MDYFITEGTEEGTHCRIVRVTPPTLLSDLVISFETSISLR